MGGRLFGFLGKCFKALFFYPIEPLSIFDGHDQSRVVQCGAPVRSGCCVRFGRNHLDISLRAGIPDQRDQVPTFFAWPYRHLQGATRPDQLSAGVLPDL